MLSFQTHRFIDNNEKKQFKNICHPVNLEYRVWKDRKLFWNLGTILLFESKEITAQHRYLKAAFLLSLFPDLYTDIVLPSVLSWSVNIVKLLYRDCVTICIQHFLESLLRQRKKSRFYNLSSLCHENSKSEYLSDFSKKHCTKFRSLHCQDSQANRHEISIFLYLSAQRDLECSIYLLEVCQY